MIHRPPDMQALEFARLSALRAVQLMRGCTPRVPASDKAVVTAQREVAEGKVLRAPADPA
jgi:DNA-directed RNA polymerase subunit K/omega